MQQRAIARFSSHKVSFSAMLLTLKISLVYTDLFVGVLEVEEDSPRHLVLSGHLDALHALYITQRHRLKCGKNIVRTKMLFLDVIAIKIHSQLFFYI